MQTNAPQERLMKIYAELQEEILNIGWQGILEKYHPDTNLDDPEAGNVFKLYKYIYEDMKKKVVI